MDPNTQKHPAYVKVGTKINVKGANSSNGVVKPHWSHINATKVAELIIASKLSCKSFDT